MLIAPVCRLTSEVRPVT